MDQVLYYGTNYKIPLFIQQAIEADSFSAEAQHISDGDIEVGLQQATHVVEGEVCTSKHACKTQHILGPIKLEWMSMFKHSVLFMCFIILFKKVSVSKEESFERNLSSGIHFSFKVRLGGQEHFYLETQCTIAVPKCEDGEIEIFCSCQSPTTAQVTIYLLNCSVLPPELIKHVSKFFLKCSQMLLSAALGVPANRIVVRVKRMGKNLIHFHNSCLHKSLTHAILS